MDQLITEILFEDEDLLVLSKPTGMIVNNADTSKDVFTLQDFVEKNFSFKKTRDTDFSKRAGIVHRLDKQTSGVILVAKNIESFESLQKQFKDRAVEKVYRTLVHGKLVEKGTINAPIGRLPWNRMRFGIVPNGKESLTEFKVLKYYKTKEKKGDEILSFVEVYPKTGRTHQIRVHFQYAGFPVFGDELYAGRKIYANDKKLLDRHFLHASELSFDHPRTGKRMTFKSKLPIELENLLSNLTHLNA